MASRDLLAGLVQGIGQSIQKKREREEKEELKKLQIKLFKQQLEDKEKTQAAFDKIMEAVSGKPEIERTTFEEGPLLEQGGPSVQPQQQMGLTDLLADPEMAMNLLRSGRGKDVVALEQLRGQQEQEEFFQNFLRQNLGGAPGGTAGAPGGMELTGIKLGPKGQVMPDFERPKFKTEVPGSDGMSMIGLDEYGRELYRRPVAPGERKTDPKIKAASMVKETKQRTDRIANAIDDAVGRVNGLTAGLLGAPLSNIPGTAARDLRADIDTIRANIGFDALNAMRQASPTGGALGQVSERELGFLQSVMANLEQSQSPEQLRRNLLRAKEEIRKSWERILTAYEQDFGEIPEGSRPEALKPQETQEDPLGIR